MLNVDIFVVFFCLSILIYASQSDIRKRSVSNIPWLAMITVGIGLLVLRVITSGTYLLGQAALSFVLTFAVSYLFFRIRLFGAADAKCLISLAVLFPESPALVILSQRFPLFGPVLPEIFPFALSTLMNAALLAMVVPFFLGFHNLLNLGFGGFWQQLGMVFTSYQMPIAQLAKRKRVRFVSPYPDKDGRLGRAPTFGGVEINHELIKQLESYQKAGKLGNEVWVTPELPFIVFITAGFMFALFMGNLVFTPAISSQNLSFHIHTRWRLG